jgi:hypothetical protein
MKQMMLLLVLMMGPGLGAETIALLNQARALGVPGERLGVRPVHEYGTEHQINALNEKSYGNEKDCFAPVGLTRSK